jgi:ABC-type multidrug transport system ATPase subunit
LRGINGVGKSTLLSVIAGALAPDGGNISINGTDLINEPVKARRNLAWAPDKPDVYAFMTGEEFLQLVGMARDMSGASDENHVQQLLEQWQLMPHLKKRFQQMSLGMQKKFLLVAAFMGRPPLLLLDEPGNALDTQALQTLSAQVTLVSAEACVFVSSHISTLTAPITSEWDLAQGKLSRIDRPDSLD